jgi:hypothetical protein
VIFLYFDRLAPEHAPAELDESAEMAEQNRQPEQRLVIT